VGAEGVSGEGESVGSGLGGKVGVGGRDGGGETRRVGVGGAVPVGAAESSPMATTAHTPRRGFGKWSATQT